jgi:hypothetical protein
LASSPPVAHRRRILIVAKLTDSKRTAEFFDNVIECFEEPLAVGHRAILRFYKKPATETYDRL